MSPPQELSIRSRLVVDLFLLTWTAGVLDALNFLRARVFIANMTGNAVLLGLAILGPERWRALEVALAVAAFGAGVLFGGIVLLRLRHPDAAKDLKIGTGLELPFAILFTVLWIVFPRSGPAWVNPALIATAGCAVGIQSVAARRLRLAGVATTFLTGTFTTAIVSFLERKEPWSRPQDVAKSSPLVLGGMFAVYVVAALTGGALTSASSPLAPIDALAPLIVVLMRSSMRTG